MLTSVYNGNLFTNTHQDSSAIMHRQQNLTLLTTEARSPVSSRVPHRG